MSQSTVVLGVTGSIAAYKAAQLCSGLVQRGFDVHVIMTESAAKLVAPLTFETLSGNRVPVDTFERHTQWNVEHVALAKRADAFLVAPATANVLAKMAHGLADDMLTSTLLAARCPKIVCPAMNTGMYENEATQENLRTLRARGVAVVDADTGYLACGDEGKGRFARQELIMEALDAALEPEKPLAGSRVLVTAGATREALDPVRFLTNHSTGKMGYAVARAAAALGAREVTLLSCNSALPDPWAVRVERAASARELYERTLDSARSADYVVMAAAVADYRPARPAQRKIKKSEGAFSLPLERTEDILSAVAARRSPGQKICGFAMETEDLLENAREKLRKKGCDMIVANSLTQPGAGFAADTNVAALVTAGGVQPLALMSKSALALEILRRLAAL